MKITGNSVTWTSLIYTKRFTYPGNKNFSFRNVYRSIPKHIAGVSFQVVLQYRYPGGKVQIRSPFLSHLDGSKINALNCRASWDCGIPVWIENHIPFTHNCFSFPAAAHCSLASSGSIKELLANPKLWPEGKFIVFSQDFPQKLNHTSLGNFFCPVAATVSLPAALTLLCLLSFIRPLTSSACNHPNFFWEE